MKKLILGILLLLSVAGAVGAFQAYSFLSARPSDSNDRVTFHVEAGQSFRVVARNLEQQGFITDSFKFSLYARMTGVDGKIRMGEYALQRNLTAKQVLNIVTSGRSIEYAVTIPEGANKYEIADSYQKLGFGTRDEFLRLVDDSEFARELLGEDLPSLEGYLFPETYHVTRFTGVKGFIRMMVNRFVKNFEEARAGKDIKNMSRHEVVTLASIIEKETGAPEERNIISAVFHNRLQKGMRLQTDPTVMYGVLDQTGEAVRNITRAHLQTPTRYNTYTQSGLPYGPIANPGFEALRAAFNPASVNYLFFVSRNDGTHIFTETYADHNQAVRKFQLDPRAREGKSWRDLKKRGQSSTPKPSAH